MSNLGGGLRPSEEMSASFSELNTRLFNEFCPK